MIAIRLEWGLHFQNPRKRRREENMTTEQAKKQPQNMTELFNLARENLKAKGIDRPATTVSNYQAAAQLQRKLLDSIFMESHYRHIVLADKDLVTHLIYAQKTQERKSIAKPGNQLS